MQTAGRERARLVPVQGPQRAPAALPEQREHMIDKTMSMEAYHAHQAYGSSTAKLALKSLQLVKDRIDGLAPVEDRAHFQIGRLIHAMRLEPESVMDRLTIDGPVNPNTGKPYGRDTKAFREWQAQNPDKLYVEPWIPTLLRRCPDEVSALFVGGNPEVSVIHTLQPLGIQVKCRPDYLSGTTIIDLKTCNDVDVAEREIARRQYWFSAAWYRMVMLAETDRPHRFRFVFTEKKPPYRWRIVDLDADYMMWADDTTDRIVSEIATAHHSGDWSDVGDLYVMASRPDFLSDEDESEEE